MQPYFILKVASQTALDGFSRWFSAFASENKLSNDCRVRWVRVPGHLASVTVIVPDAHFYNAEVGALAFGEIDRS